MTAPRSPFDTSVALTAVARDINVDQARAALIAEALDWLRQNMSGGAVRVEFDAVIARVADTLDTDAVSHLADAADADTLVAASGDDAARFRGDQDRMVAHTLRCVVKAIAPALELWSNS